MREVDQEGGFSVTGRSGEDDQATMANRVQEVGKAGAGNAMLYTLWDDDFVWEVNHSS